MQKKTMTLLGTFAAVGAAAAVAAAAPGGSTGPSSSESPYLVRSQPGVVFTSIISAGDSVGGYRMAGTPDGLGAFDNGDGTFTVLENHEFVPANGAVRAHGAKGSFVAKWTIRKSDLSVVSGEDLIKQIATWNAGSGSFDAPATGIALYRLCSATLAPISAFYDAATGKGYDGRIFTNGEEGSTGRAFGHTMEATSYELASLGKQSWENQSPNPATGAKTVVVGTDDSGGGRVYVYVGDKKTAGNPVEKAGLTGGTLYGIKVDGSSFTGVSLGDVSGLSYAQLDAAANAAGVTGFDRPEDGAWDPTHPTDFYFATTASFGGQSQLWRLRFADPANPAAGGTIETLLDGTETGGTSERFHMLDNLTMNGRGQLILQEDPGNQPYLARVWHYDPPTDTLTQIAEHDPARFAPGGTLTVDEESSGVIDVSEILGEGWYLIADQPHHDYGDPEIVEDGQLLAMHVPPGKFPKKK